MKTKENEENEAMTIIFSPFVSAGVVIYLRRAQFQHSTHIVLSECARRFYIGIGAKSESSGSTINSNEVSLSAGVSVCDNIHHSPGMPMEKLRKFDADEIHSTFSGQSVIRNPLPLPLATSTPQVDADSFGEAERRSSLRLMLTTPMLNAFNDVDCHHFSRQCSQFGPLARSDRAPTSRRNYYRKAADNNSEPNNKPGDNRAQRDALINTVAGKNVESLLRINPQ